MIAYDDRGCTPEARLTSFTNRGLNREVNSKQTEVKREKVVKKDESKSTEPRETNWSTTDMNKRIIYVMGLLVNKYKFPIYGASGLVGNLKAESELIPNRLERASVQSPMTNLDYDEKNLKSGVRKFSPGEVLYRDRPPNDKTKGFGPVFPGVGIAQWTSPDRRYGLFIHQGIGEGILFNMDAQVDYLVTELIKKYNNVYKVLMNTESIEEASDIVLNKFEIPKDKDKNETITLRRQYSQNAKDVYEASLH